MSAPIPPLSPEALSAALGGSIQGRTAVAEVTRRLLDYFTSGRMPVGARLPPERQLAESLGVGRSAIRESLAALEILGLVTVRPGSGTYLRGGASELLPQTLSWGVLLSRQDTEELIGVRHALEVQAAREAAHLITDDQLSELNMQVAAMQHNVSNYPEFVAADLRFHQVVGAASGNNLLAGISQTARSLLRVWVERAVHTRRHVELTCHEHSAIAAALAARDAERAADTMNDHMESAGARLLAEYDDDRAVGE